MYAGMTSGYDCAYHQHQERKDCKGKLNINNIYLPKKLVTLNMWCSEAYKSDRMYAITLYALWSQQNWHISTPNVSCTMDRADDHTQLTYWRDQSNATTLTCTSDSCQACSSTSLDEN